MPDKPDYEIGRFSVDIRVEEASEAFVTGVSCFSSETNAWCSIDLQANVPGKPYPVNVYVPIEAPEPTSGLLIGALFLVGLAGHHFRR